MVIISLSNFHQRVRFDCVFPIEIPLFPRKKHFSILTCLELILKVFSNSALLMSCPQGPFGSWKFDFLIFSSPLFLVSCPQGPFGGWKFDFFNFSSPLSSGRARRGLLGAGNLTFSIVQLIIHPYSPLFALICLYLPLFTFNFGRDLFVIVVW